MTNLPISILRQSILKYDFGVLFTTLHLNAEQKKNQKKKFLTSSVVAAVSQLNTDKHRSREINDHSN